MEPPPFRKWLGYGGISFLPSGGGDLSLRVAVELAGIEPASIRLPKPSLLHACSPYPRRLSPSNSAEALLTLLISPVSRESGASASASGLTPLQIPTLSLLGTAARFLRPRQRTRCRSHLGRLVCLRQFKRPAYMKTVLRSNVETRSAPFVPILYNKEGSTSEIRPPGGIRTHDQSI